VAVSGEREALTPDPSARRSGEKASFAGAAGGLPLEEYRIAICPAEEETTARGSRDATD